METILGGLNTREIMGQQNKIFNSTWSLKKNHVVLAIQVANDELVAS